MYRDAVQANCEAMVLLSGDSDLTPALDAIKEHNASIRIGVVLPRKEGTERPPSQMLSKFADWTRSVIRTSELESCQMPRLIPTNRKPAIRPDYW